MANLLYKNIGTNYKGFLNLDSTINTPLDATLRAVTDGMGNSSVLSLSTLGISVNGSTDLGANTASTNIVTLKSTTRNQIQVPSGSTLEFWYSAAAEGARLNSSGFQIGEGTITQNGALTIKGSGSNILSLRNSSDVQKAYFSDDGALNSGGGWADTIGYTSYLKYDTLALYDGNTIKGITGSNGFVFSTKIMLGGTSASYPAIKRNGAEINFRLADDSANCNIVASRITALDGTSQFTNARIYNINSYDNAVTAIGIANTTGALTINGATNNAQVNIKGSGSNILSLRNSSNVEVSGALSTGILFSDGISIGQTNVNLKGIVQSGAQIQVNYVNSGGVRFSNSSSGFKTLIVGEYSEDMISMGGITASFPAIKRNGAAIDFRLADDSGYANITGGIIYAGDTNNYITNAGQWLCNVNFTFNGRINNSNSGFVDIGSLVVNSAMKFAALTSSRPTTVGQLYQDTAANILANGDKVIGIRV